MKKHILVPWKEYQKLIQGKVQEVETSSYDEEKILSVMPKQLKNRAKALLNVLSGSYISWNSIGEIILKEDVVSGSNICDLLKCVLYKYKEFSPVGLKIFVKALADNNVPETLLYPECRSYIQEIKECGMSHSMSKLDESCKSAEKPKINKSKSWVTF